MAVRRKTTKKTRESLYAASRYLSAEVERELGVVIPFDVYSQDPKVAKDDPKFAIEEDFFVRWEPGLTDGPTSSRFAVVDYNGDTGHLAPKAVWYPSQEVFADPNGYILDRNNVEPLQFHQLNVWAILQRALAFFEAGTGLGRRIPFGFEGNRLIVVPHAGYGQNAFYDRMSKSLQFYYFDDGDERVYTCLSADIVNHEFGHAVLDGVRPYFMESVGVETGAFHEFTGDLTAILILLRNNDFRGKLAETTEGNLDAADHLKHIARQFGEAISGVPYLRTAGSDMKMSDIEPEHGPHKVSEVLTATMFDILKDLSDHYLKRENDRYRQRVREVESRTDLSEDEREEEKKKRLPSAKTAFWNAIQRMQCMAVQPLDLLPPVDVTFRDYALAVLRADSLANPMDPRGHRERALKVFVKRGVLSERDANRLREPDHLFDRLNLRVFHDIDSISRSRSGAYAFLNDNRDELLIPPDQDVIVADLYDAEKLTRQARRLPRQIVLVYIWREDIVLEGRRFRQYEGKRTSMLCGGTLVFDENGAVVNWARKPGTHGGESRAWEEEMKAGRKRKQKLLDELARRISAGQVGAALGSSKGMLGTHVPTVSVSTDGDELQFKLSPHMRLSGEDHDYYQGGPRWEPSS